MKFWAKKSSRYKFHFFQKSNSLELTCIQAHHSRLTRHFEWFSIENCIEKCFEVLSLIEFSIEIPLFSIAKFTRTDIFWIKNSQLKINNYFNSPLTSQDYSLFIIRYFLFLIRYSPLTTHISLRFNRVLDTNFTFFKSKIHSNWHIFNLTTNHSRLTRHFEWFR